MTRSLPAWTRRRWFRRLAVVLWFSLLAVVLTWPMVTDPYGAALGSIHADGMKHLWTLWWMQAEVWQEGSFPFQTDLINYPAGMDLYPIEPLNGLVAVAMPWVGVVGMANLLVFLNLLATGLAGMWFGTEVSGKTSGGLVAGTVLEGSAVMAFFVHVGVGELLHLWWLPLGLAILIRARRTMEWRWFFALAGSLIGAMLSCFYLGFFLATSVAVWALTTLWAGKQTPGLLLRYTLAAGLAIAVVVPVTQTFSGSYRSGSVPEIGLKRYLTEDHGQPITDPPSARAELAQLVTPLREPTRREDAAYGGGRYLGGLALLLALGGLIRDPKRALPWVAVGGVGVVLSLGSFLTVDGEVVRTASGARIRMPIFWLNRILGYFAEPLNFPVRYLAVTTTALAGLAALSIRRTWMILLAPIVVLEVGWGQMLAWPWATFSPRDARVLEPMQEMGDGAVIDLALVVRSDQENRFNALSTQIRHGRRLNAIPLERIEYFARDGMYFVKATQLLTDLTPLYNNRGGQLSSDYRADAAVLRDAGFEWVLVSYRSGREAMPVDLVSQMNQLCGEAVINSRGLAVWKLPEVNHSDEELAEWKVQHAAAMMQLSRMDPGMGPRQ